MPLEPFDRICPEIASAERHACDVNSPALGVPLGTYVLREFYCTEPGCDCRRVLVQLIPLNDAPLRVVATVNFGWEKAEYYRKWSRDPELCREMAGATLEPFGEQGPQARRFLEVFKQAIQKPNLVMHFRRHYRLVKEATDPGRARDKG